MTYRVVAVVLVLAVLTGCRGTARRGAEVQGASAPGEHAIAPVIPPDRGATLEENLARAKAAHDTDPGNEDAAIWHGRRLAYLGRYTEAIGVYSDALTLHPESFRLLRHRGHRYISVRELDRAIADLQRAAALIEGVPDEIEPDGAPNAQNKPRSTSHSNIWYHLALARYLKGDFARAADAWERCLEFSRVNDDMLVATSYWLYLSLRRAGDAEREARAATVLTPIKAEMDVIENFAYHRLLLLFKGEQSEGAVRGGARGGPGDAGVADATIGYGLGAWKLVEGDRITSREWFRRVVGAPGANRAAFGYIAAEAELVRLPR